MQNNQTFDILVIGDSLEGALAIQTLAKLNQNVSIALISKKLNNTKKYKNISNLTILELEAVHVVFNRGLYILYASDQKDTYTICSCNLIVATGAKTMPLVISEKLTLPVYHRIESAPKISKDSQVIVVGNDTETVKLALKAATKYKYVYLCNNLFNLNCSTKLLEKLESVDNIVILPSCKIIDYKLKNDKLLEITLDTYSVINCSYVFAAMPRKSDISWIPTNFIELDNDKIVTNELNAVDKLPGLYAIGECSYNFKKNSLVDMSKTILNKVYNGGI